MVTASTSSDEEITAAREKVQGQIEEYCGS